ncbi:MAG: class I SAM-dependent methyltransferase [Deinococcales bacterium]
MGALFERSIRGNVGDLPANLQSLKGVEFLQIDAEEIPFADNSFDAVIANHMLYHVADRPKALGEIARVLKANGKLYATTVGERHMGELTVLVNAFRKEPANFRLGFILENAEVTQSLF